jgi:TRAP-type mannitol/chloroaromatic compound transport system substrate-binding protein
LSELPRPLKAVPFIRYAYSKLGHENVREEYLYDCLWSMATDMKFMDNKKPSYPRWKDVVRPIKAIPQESMTKQDIINHFKSMRRRID